MRIRTTRGDTFRRRFTLENTNPDGDAWTFAMFDEVKWTLRTSQEQGDADTDDEDVVAQVTKTGGGVYVDPGDASAFFVRVEASVAFAWPIARLYYDVQATIDGSPQQVFTLEAGELTVARDITRAP